MERSIVLVKRFSLGLPFNLAVTPCHGRGLRHRDGFEF